jgi:hypothetical protein
VNANIQHDAVEISDHGDNVPFVHAKPQKVLGAMTEAEKKKLDQRNADDIADAIVTAEVEHEDFVR